MGTSQTGEKYKMEGKFKDKWVTWFLDSEQWMLFLARSYSSVGTNLLTPVRQQCLGRDVGT